MKRKSSISTKLASMVDRNILRFITDDHTSSRVLRQSVGVRVTKTVAPERRRGISINKGVVCEVYNGLKLLHLVITFMVVRSFIDGANGSNFIEHQLSVVN
jgi:hypothetical protein